MKAPRPAPISSAPGPPRRARPQARRTAPPGAAESHDRDAPRALSSPASSPPRDGGAKVWGSRFFIVLVQLEASSSPTFQVSERADGAPAGAPHEPPHGPSPAAGSRCFSVRLGGWECWVQESGEPQRGGQTAVPASRGPSRPACGESVLSVRAALWCYLRGHRCWPRPPPCSALASTARMGEQGAPTHGPGDPAGLVLTSGSGQEPGDVAAPRAASARHGSRLGLGASDPLLPLCRTWTVGGRPPGKAALYCESSREGEGWAPASARLPASSRLPAPRSGRARTSMSRLSRGTAALTPEPSKGIGLGHHPCRDFRHTQDPAPI